MSRRGIAYHEAAHGVVALFLGLDVEEITIRPRARRDSGHVRASRNRTDFQGAVMGYAGAYAAIKAGASDHSTRPSEGDVEELSRLPKSGRDEAMKTARLIVDSRWRDIERVAAALLASSQNTP